jgi:hypothetical protein
MIRRALLDFRSKNNIFDFLNFIIFFSFFFSDRRAQPDNRVGNENCAAILNNFYGDGIKFHDVACHHTKPALCEC